MESGSLAKFITAIVKKPRRGRYLSFLANEKRKKKLLASLDHDLERDIEPKVLAQSLSEEEWLSPAVLFSSTGALNIEFLSLREAYEEASWEGGWLIIGTSATYGIYRPEGWADRELAIKL